MLKTREKERSEPATFAGQAEGRREMAENTTAESHALSPLEKADVVFLVTASELRDRKKKRHAQELPPLSEAIRRLVEIGSKAKG